MLSLLLAACLAPTETTHQTANEQFIGAVDDFMNRLHAAGRFHGALVISRHGNLVYENGWGFANLEAGQAFTADTAVDGASLAKPFVAASLWLLVGEERVSLDTKVQVYLPSFPNPKTTVRHLLEHSAGLREFGQTSGRTNAQLVAALDPVANFPSGERFEYCNECFDTLALLVERVTGQALIDFLEERFLEPLGMESVFVRPVRLMAWTGVRTLSYRSVEGEPVLLDVFDNEAFYGSSNLYFSARDLSRWADAWIAGAVLPAELLDRALQIPVFANGEVSALNRSNWYFDQPSGPLLFNGHLRGFHHTVYWDPSTGISLVWVSNVLENRPSPQLLTQALLQLVEGLPIATVPALGFERPEENEVARITGQYLVPELGRIQVELEGNLPTFRIGQGARHIGYPADAYYLPDFDAEVGFSDLREGRYRQIHWLTTFGEKTGKREKGLAAAEKPAP